MTACATCFRELQPEWKYCIYCGTRTSVPLTAAIEAVAGSERAHGAENDALTAFEKLANAPLYDDTDTGVLKLEDIPADDEPAASADAPPADAKFSVLAIIALVLGCLLSPLAALFGHIAVSQMSKSGERGTAIAWVAIVLGYLSLAAWLVFGISYLVLNS